MKITSQRRRRTLEALVVAGHGAVRDAARGVQLQHVARQRAEHPVLVGLAGGGGLAGAGR